MILFFIGISDSIHWIVRVQFGFYLEKFIAISFLNELVSIPKAQLAMVSRDRPWNTSLMSIIPSGVLKETWKMKIGHCE
jgi:hypothetical protein